MLANWNLGTQLRLWGMVRAGVNWDSPEMAVVLVSVRALRCSTYGWWN